MPHSDRSEQLGVDTVIVDELHLFKNLSLVSRHTRLPGLGNMAGSDRAMDMYLKTQHVQKKNNGRGFIGMTGTPVSNSLTEMYTLMRYFMQKRLRKIGLGRLDNWLQTFANIETAMEAAPEGGYRERSRVRDFSNIPEMTRMYREFADVRTADELKLPVPPLHGGAPENVVAEPSNALSAFMGDLRERAMCLTGQRGEIPDPREDNFLKMMSDARKASLDMRLVAGYEDTPDDPGSKVNQCVSNVLEDYHSSHEYSGTQMVFLDLSTPKGNNESTEHPSVTRAAQEARMLAESLGLAPAVVKAEESRARKAAKEAVKERKRALKEEARSGAKAQRAEAETEARENGLSAKEIKAAGKVAEEEYLKAFEAEQDDPNRMENPDGEEVEDEQEVKQKHQVYRDIKDKLIAQGIPEHEIAFAHDFETDARKNDLREKMNDGRIRVLLGSTGKMGAGLNAQQRLYSLHHLDCPWKPADLEQREGRIIRQGNLHLYGLAALRGDKNEHTLPADHPDRQPIPIRVRRYASKGSLDEFQWQQIENKAKFIRQARTGAVEGRRMEDIGEAEMQAAAMKMASSDSPELSRLTELKIRKAQLDSLHRSHVNEQSEWLRTSNALPGQIAWHQGMAQKAESHAAMHQEHQAQNPKFAMTIGARSFDKREEAGKALREAHGKATAGMKVGESVPIGEYGRFKVHAERHFDPFSPEGKQFRLKLNLHDHNGAHVASVSEAGDAYTDSGLTQSLDHALRTLPKVAQAHGDAATQKQRELEDLQRRMSGGDSWEHADEYDKIKREQAVLEAKQRARRLAAQQNKSPEEIEEEVRKAGETATA